MCDKRMNPSPVGHLVTPLPCVSLSMNTQPSVPAIAIPPITKIHQSLIRQIWICDPSNQAKICHIDRGSLQTYRYLIHQLVPHEIFLSQILFTNNILVNQRNLWNCTVWNFGVSIPCAAQNSKWMYRESNHHLQKYWIIVNSIQSSKATVTFGWKKYNFDSRTWNGNGVTMVQVMARCPVSTKL